MLPLFIYAALGFVRIRPERLLVSAIKKAYSEDNIIIRLFNTTAKPLEGILEILPGIRRAWLADLNEEKKKRISVRKDGSIALKVEPKEIVTVSIVPKEYEPV